jgi:tetratricopeptide (TPR) repeat protein
LSDWALADFLRYDPKIIGTATFPDIGDYAALTINKNLTRAELAEQWMSNGRVCVDADPAFAETCFVRAIGEGYTSPDAHFELANLLLQRGNTAEAIECLEQAVERFPRDGQAQDMLRKLLEATGH